MLLVICIAAIFGLKVKIWFQDREEMRRNLREIFGVGRWSDSCPSKFDIEHVIWSGSAFHFYELWIPPAETDEFLAAVQQERPSTRPIKTVEGKSFGEKGQSPDWWRPEDERELSLITLDSWSIAVAKDTGHVYVMHIGH
jgi:hypothetical protein